MNKIVNKLFSKNILNYTNLAIILLVSFSFISRFIYLDIRAIHHDESLHGYYSWLLSKGYGYRDRKVDILQVELINKSVAPISLNYIGQYTFHNDYKFIELKPRSSKTIYIKTKEVKEKVNLEFEILNYVVAPKTNLKTIKTITIE